MRSGQRQLKSRAKTRQRQSCFDPRAAKAYLALRGDLSNRRTGIPSEWNRDGAFFRSNQLKRTSTLKPPKRRQMAAIKTHSPLDATASDKELGQAQGRAIINEPSPPLKHTKAHLDNMKHALRSPLNQLIMFRATSQASIRNLEIELLTICIPGS